jgi:hypothetical protein
LVHIVISASFSVHRLISLLQNQFYIGVAKKTSKGTKHE